MKGIIGELRGVLKDIFISIDFEKNFLCILFVTCADMRMKCR